MNVERTFRVAPALIGTVWQMGSGPKGGLGTLGSQYVSVARGQISFFLHTTERGFQMHRVLNIYLL